MTAFERAWSIAKVDFVTGPLPKSRRSDSMGTSYHRPRTYKYRVPTGKDAEGDLIYGPREHEVTDTSFVNLPRANKFRGLTTLAGDEHNVIDREEDWGPWNNPSGRMAQFVSGRGIMETTTHEAMHDADPIARHIDRQEGRPTFGARGVFGHNPNPVDHKGEFFGVHPPEAGSMARDHNLAAETMAYLGEYGEAPGRANLATMRHSDVDKVDVKWMLNRLAEARKREGIAEEIAPDSYLRRNRTFAGSIGVNTPEEVLDLARGGRSQSGVRMPTYVPQPKSTKKIIGGHALDTPETANFTVPKSQQIRRNLINAANEMAMTRMTESGEFLENPATSQEWYDQKRVRPSAARIKAAKRETSPVRRAINAHWKKVEAGNAPVPNSIEDLPENVQQLIGQQQIRSILGLQRGRASEPIRMGKPAEIAHRRLLDKTGIENWTHGPDAQRDEWDKLPFEEREAHLREYLTALGGMMQSDPKFNRWGEIQHDYEWSSDIEGLMGENTHERMCREHEADEFGRGPYDGDGVCTGDKKDLGESKTGCDGYDKASGKVYGDLMNDFPDIFDHPNKYPGIFSYKGQQPGEKHRIVPHRYTPPSGIPEQDWLKMLQWAKGRRQPIDVRDVYHTQGGEKETWFGNRRV